MKLKAKAVPYSSVVGSSIMLTSESDEVIAQVIITVPNPRHDYKAVAVPVTALLVDAINRAHMVLPST